MRVFVAGASGAIGRQLLPLLVRAGHAVVGMTRSEAKADALRALGAEPVVADALNRAAVVRAVAAAAPDIIVHELTALASFSDFRHFDREFDATNRLRTEGTDILIAAAQVAGGQRLVAQSFAGWPYAREGAMVKCEDDRLDPDPPAQFRRTVAAIRHLENAVLAGNGFAGTVLRYGAFYGLGTSVAIGGQLVEAIRQQRFPIIGAGTGMWSFIHIDDAAAATLAAIENASPGLFNITDDEPAPVREWLPFLAAAIGAPPPRHLPAWLGRLLVGRVGLAMMTEVRGAANTKAKRELGWRPRFSTWREGFRNGLAD
ncbi:MAG TPA: NAD(P)-dependent oxidoreductase [Stellaceae bacterium]|nr:NAD(P)-dependent oxidoreductase [Stellaceae bacterium]